MKFTLTNDGSAPAEIELGVQPKQTLQPGESIAVELLPQQPVIVRVPENLADLEEKARRLEDAKALIAEEEARQKAEAKEKAKAEKAAKKAADPQTGDETAAKTDETVTDTSADEQKPAETGQLFADPAADQQNQGQTAAE